MKAIYFALICLFIPKTVIDGAASLRRNPSSAKSTTPIAVDSTRGQRQRAREKTPASPLVDGVSPPNVLATARSGRRGSAKLERLQLIADLAGETPPVLPAGYSPSLAASLQSAGHSATSDEISTVSSSVEESPFVTPDALAPVGSQKYSYEENTDSNQPDSTVSMGAARPQRIRQLIAGNSGGTKKYPMFPSSTSADDESPFVTPDSMKSKPSPRAPKLDHSSGSVVPTPRSVRFGTPSKYVPYGRRDPPDTASTGSSDPPSYVPTAMYDDTIGETPPILPAGFPSADLWPAAGRQYMRPTFSPTEFYAVPTRRPHAPSKVGRPKQIQGGRRVSSVNLDNFRKKSTVTSPLKTPKPLRSALASRVQKSKEQMDEEETAIREYEMENEDDLIKLKANELILYNVDRYSNVEAERFKSLFFGDRPTEESYLSTAHYSKLMDYAAHAPDTIEKMKTLVRDLRFLEIYLLTKFAEHPSDYRRIVEALLDTAAAGKDTAAVAQLRQWIDVLIRSSVVQHVVDGMAGIYKWLERIDEIETNTFFITIKRRYDDLQKRCLKRAAVFTDAELRPFRAEFEAVDAAVPNYLDAIKEAYRPLAAAAKAARVKSV